MKGTVFHGPRDVRVERVEDPSLKTPEDAIVRITRGGLDAADLKDAKTLLDGLTG